VRTFKRGFLVTFLISILSLAFSMNISFSNACKKDIKVGAYYYIWWGIPFNNHWKHGVSYTPFLGEYNSSDPVTADRHILWAKQHGIDFFAVSWLGNGTWINWDFDDIDRNLKNGLLKAEHLCVFKFCLFYESNIILSTALQAGVNFTNIFINDMTYTAENYFTNPSYLKIDEKPVIFIYNLSYIYDKLGTTATQKLFDDLKQRLNVYLVGDVGGGSSPNGVNPNLLYSMDAVTSYFFSDPSKGWQKILEEAETYYPEWRLTMNSKEINFIPNAYPGFDNTAQNKSNSVVLPPNETMFERMLDIAFTYVDDYLKIVMITSWNEWLESTVIEPSMEFGEIFLQKVLDAKTPKPTCPIIWIYFAFGVIFGIAVAIAFYYVKPFKNRK